MSENGGAGKALLGGIQADKCNAKLSNSELGVVLWVHPDAIEKTSPTVGRRMGGEGKALLRGNAS